VSKPDVGTVLRVITILEPLVSEVVEWLDGDGPEPPALRQLPPQLRSELALERAKRRAAG
jgi:hypothetical protein